MSSRDKQAEIIHRLVKKGGLRARIDAMCCSCIYDPYSEGTWRKQVEDCTAPDCPLFEVRPKSEYRQEVLDETS